MTNRPPEEVADKLSDRLAAAPELADKLREECVRMLGWEFRGYQSGSFNQIWGRGDQESRGCPKLDLTEIVAEIERRGWQSAHTMLGPDGCEFDVFNGQWCRTGDRRDRNIRLAALTALVMALENEDAGI